MPPYYIGGGTDPFAGFGKPPMPGPAQRWNFGRPDVKGPGPGGDGTPFTGNGGQVASDPLFPSTPTAAPTAAPNVLGANAVRASGPAKGYDASYLQNLATAIGGLFSRPQGNLSFNPLGNLSEISPPSGMEGNAPLPGLPSTWLQDALNGLGFSFTPVAPKPAGPVNPAGGRGRDGGGRRFNLA